MKFIRIEQNGYEWCVPLEVIAKNRSEYYAKTDPDTTYDEEYKFIMEDDYEGIDWFQNNMDWADVKDFSTLLKSPGVIEPDFSESPEMEIFETK